MRHSKAARPERLGAIPGMLPEREGMRIATPQVRSGAGSEARAILAGQTRQHLDERLQPAQ
jgi:hypothetical protein